MQIKLSGRPAFIVAIGLLALAASPAKACTGADCQQRIVLAQNDDQQAKTGTAVEPAASSTKPSRKSSRHARRSRSEKSTTHASKSSDKSSERKVSETNTPVEKRVSRSSVPPSVANANAEMDGPAPAGDSAKSSFTAIPGATVPLDSPPQAVVSGQASAPDQTVLGATAQTATSDQPNNGDHPATAPAAKPASQTVTAASGDKDDTWSQTSLIGKIFVAFGGLLTLASAARMMIG